MSPILATLFEATPRKVAAPSVEATRNGMRRTR
jgi:hypothetical protein